LSAARIFCLCMIHAETTQTYTLSLHDALPIYKVAESQSPTTGIWSSNGGFDWRGKDPDFLTDFGTLSVTPEYGNTIGWQFVKGRDRKSTRLNSSHVKISYAVFCLKKKKRKT